MHVFVYMYIYMYICIYKYLVFLSAGPHAYNDICMDMYIYMHIQMFIHTHIHRNDEWDNSRLGNLVFLSARPHVYKDVSESITYQKFRWLQETRGLHTSPSLLAGIYVFIYIYAYTHI
jgi:hypothetical protein